ncbi:MAG TPA: hypothetical protein VM491_22015 [Burkholderiaceae bacterium]|nr:hypothetical protein [Burkholderiaceae bacterium]
MKNPIEPRRAPPPSRAATAAEREPPPVAPREPVNELGRALLRRLPASVSLRYTASDFGHIVNRLAAVWHDRGGFERAIESLLVDERAGREGFPYPVLQELWALRSYYDRRVAGTLPLQPLIARQQRR